MGLPGGVGVVWAVVRIFVGRGDGDGARRREANFVVIKVPEEGKERRIAAGGS
jgi:hypothetical protein